MFCGVSSQISSYVRMAAGLSRLSHDSLCLEHSHESQPIASHVPLFCWFALRYIQLILPKHIVFIYPSLHRHV